MKQIALVALAIVMGVGLTSCNTMIGLGRDVRQLGEGLEKTGNRQSGTSQGNY